MFSHYAGQSHVVEQLEALLAAQPRRLDDLVAPPPAPRPAGQRFVDPRSKLSARLNTVIVGAIIVRNLRPARFPELLDRERTDRQATVRQSWPRVAQHLAESFAKELDAETGGWAGLTRRVKLGVRHRIPGGWSGRFRVGRVRSRFASRHSASPADLPRDGLHLSTS